MSRSTVTGHIPVLGAIGTGTTPLAAFHSALVAAGIAEYNLIRLSSVIPPWTAIDVTGEAQVPTGTWGDRLYCVYAERRATTSGERVWAGVGWVQRIDGGGGLFVEHDGTSEDEVSRLITASLRDLVVGREEKFTEPEMTVIGGVCGDDPICALVVAAYETAGWDGQP